MSVKNKFYSKECLPIEERVGQTLISNSYGEMTIVRASKKLGDKRPTIDVYFTEYEQIIKDKQYDRFLKGALKPDLKLAREGVRKQNNQGLWMELMEYINKNNCVVKFDNGYCTNARWDSFKSGSVLNPEYSMIKVTTKFKISDDEKYWIGETKNNEIFYFSSNDKNKIDSIKSHVWYVTKNGYLKNSKLGSLHSVILPLTKEAKEQGYDRIDHINNNPLDNRYENLRYSNAKENARNRKAIGESGITGLRCSKDNAWYGSCRYNNNSILTKRYKDKNEALIDLLIMQRFLNYTHNEHLFYMLDNISQERADFVENDIKEKIEKQKNVEYKTTCKNTFEKIDDNTYKMYDSKDRWCLVDAEDIDRVKMGNWSLCENGKRYFSGNANRKTTRLHEHIMNLSNIKYSKTFIDHLNGDSLNNKKENLIITDIIGNNINIFGKGYTIYNNRYSVFVNLWNICKSKGVRRSFDNKEDAIKFYLNCKKYLMNGRLQWKTKEELDKWIEDVKDNELDIDEVIKQHYTKLYMSLKYLIEEFDCDRSGSFLMQ